MLDYVRVRDKETGHHLSILRSQYERESDLWQELKQPATDSGGNPLQPKYHTSVSNEAEKKASPKSAATSDKES